MFLAGIQSSYFLNFVDFAWMRAFAGMTEIP
jgi:hypothetical protein